MYCTYILLQFSTLTPYLFDVVLIHGLRCCRKGHQIVSTNIPIPKLISVLKVPHVPTSMASCCMSSL
ncbi:hypothetical protein BDBG_17952 [Blastomyces gilchristii SLH14081]|uniref:Uncharacterized protein n=1 Tax=Blastomyces gilchristii (strain SLH14081) TaxID=559298 RepID=A0A179V5R4_BLAGS|nr:uncharacterized protein BDBG_17952 [Blastomyces gilchristii SLH14081]OAT13992.1 hypothetical protein BDBG_17952 [Blastomyces gilchristii SLH14081]